MFVCVGVCVCAWMPSWLLRWLVRVTVVPHATCTALSCSVLRNYKRLRLLGRFTGTKAPQTSSVIALTALPVRRSKRVRAWLGLYVCLMTRQSLWAWLNQATPSSQEQQRTAPLLTAFLKTETGGRSRRICNFVRETAYLSILMGNTLKFCYNGVNRWRLFLVTLCKS